jgi:hypothetical protein
MNSIKLDWSRLLGFDQAAANGDAVAASRLQDPRLAKLGAKFGSKLGGKRPEIAAAVRGTTSRICGVH